MLQRNTLAQSRSQYAPVRLAFRVSSTSVTAISAIGLEANDQIGRRRREIGTELKRNAWLDAIFGPEQSAHDYVRAHGIRVAELMTRPPITVDADTSLDKVVHLMERQHIKRLPVLRKGKVVGIISRANLMRALASIHRASSKTSRNDQEIRNRIVADIEKQNWAYGTDIMVLVRDGVVDLCGTLNVSSQRRALKALVREKSGVRKLNDHLRLKR
jgi:CBS-domain-containing membrane protein